jgi:hypothetical protein
LAFARLTRRFPLRIIDAADFPPKPFAFIPRRNYRIF